MVARETSYQNEISPGEGCRLSVLRHPLLAGGPNHVASGCAQRTWQGSGLSESEACKPDRVERDVGEAEGKSQSLAYYSAP